jgi:HAD superfamily phosphatase
VGDRAQLITFGIDLTMARAIVVFDIDGVVRNVGGSYRRAIMDTVEQFTQGNYRPSSQDIDQIKAEGVWNNDWKLSQEMAERYWETQGKMRAELGLSYDAVVEFFQNKYRGPESAPNTGYIKDEPLLMGQAYLQSLSDGEIAWGFFSGATRGSASFVLEQRLGLSAPLLVAMGEAPDKPEPAGLFAVSEQLAQGAVGLPVVYAGDTVADMHTIRNAKAQRPEGRWYAVGVLPPHVQETEARAEAYMALLKQAGADVVIANIEMLNREMVDWLVA